VGALSTGYAERVDHSSQSWVHVTTSSGSAQSSAQSSTHASFGAAQTSGRPDDEELGALHRVVAIGRTERAGEGELTLLALELYERGFVVTSRLRWPGPFGLFPELSPAATDDLGHAYAHRSHGGSGDGRDFRAAHRFSPALDPAAAELRLEIAEIRWRRLVPGRTELGEEAPTPGPWRFVVRLSPTADG
jgi:hypothetical protein